MAISISDGNAKYAFKTAGVVDYNAAYTVAFAVSFADFVNGSSKAYVWSINAASGNNWDALGTNSSGNLILGVASAADGTNAETAGATVLSLNTWYHVMIVRNSATDRKVYLNGVQEISATTATTSRTAVSKEFVGTRSDGYGCNAALCDFAHWNRALSVAEIAAQRRRAMPVSLNGLTTWVPMRRTTIAAAWAALKGQTWDNNYSAPSVTQSPAQAMSGSAIAIGSGASSESGWVVAIDGLFQPLFAGGLWSSWQWPLNLGAVVDLRNGLPAAWSASFSRASSAWYVGSGGLIVEAATNIPRIQHDAAGNPLGVLFEPQRVQLDQRTDDLSAWTWGGGPLTLNAAAGVDGMVSADRLGEQVGVYATHQRFRSESLTANTTYTRSIFYKPDGRDHIYVGIEGTGFNQWVVVNAATGVLHSKTGGATAHISADLVNGFRRIGVTMTTPGVVTNSYSVIRLHEGAADAYTGEAGKGGFVDARQHEVGAYPTSRIPNPVTSGTVTRAKDSLVVTGTGISTYLGDCTQGTIKATFVVPPLVTSAYPRVIELSNGDRSKYIALYVDGGGTCRVGISGSNASLGAVTAGATVTAVMCWDASGVWGSLNGGAVAGLSGTTESSTMSKMGVSMDTAADQQLAASNRLGGFIKLKVTDAELRWLSAS